MTFTSDAAWLNDWLENLVAWRSAPAVAMGGRGHLTSGFAAASLGRGWALGNSVTLLKPLEAERLSGALAEIDDFYAVDGHGDILLWSAWPTPDLAPFGWRPYDEPWLMARDGRPVSGVYPAGLTIELVRTEDRLEQFLRLVAAAFPFPDLAASSTAWDGRVLTEPHIACWIGRLNGRPVSTAATVRAGGMNGVTLVATLPEWRGWGIGGALAEHAASDGSLGRAGLLAGEEPRLVYSRLGFHPVQQFTVWKKPRQNVFSG